MDAEIRRAWRQLDDDDDVRVIVNTGRGTAYQTGIDLKESAADRADAEPVTARNGRRPAGRYGRGPRPRSGTPHAIAGCASR